MSVMFGYAELANEVTEGVASFELVLVGIELVELAAAVNEVAAAVDELEESSRLVHGLEDDGIRC